MKKSKNTLLAALAFSAAINLNGCVYGPPFDPSDNFNQNAYGPPPSGYLESELNDASYAPSDNLVQGAYGAPIEEWEIEDNNRSQNGNKGSETQTDHGDEKNTNE